MSVKFKSHSKSAEYRKWKKLRKRVLNKYGHTCDYRPERIKELYPLPLVRLKNYNKHKHYRSKIKDGIIGQSWKKIKPKEDIFVLPNSQKVFLRKKVSY